MTLHIDDDNFIDRELDDRVDGERPLETVLVPDGCSLVVRDVVSPVQDLMPHAKSPCSPSVGGDHAVIEGDLIFPR